MSIIEKLNKAIDERDGDTASELIHDDFQFYFHSSGKTIGKKEVIEWMKSGDVTNEKVRNQYFLILRKRKYILKDLLTMQERDKELNLIN